MSYSCDAYESSHYWHEPVDECVSHKQWDARPTITLPAAEDRYISQCKIWQRQTRVSKFARNVSGVNPPDFRRNIWRQKTKMRVQAGSEKRWNGNETEFTERRIDGNMTAFT